MFSDEEDREYENFNYINQEYQGEKIDINTNNIKIQEYSMKIMKTHTNNVDAYCNLTFTLSSMQ